MKNSMLCLFHKLGSSRMTKRRIGRDALTTCYTRQYVQRRLLENDGNHWKNPEDSYSVAIVDIDDFKPINDTYGPIAGDTILVMVADTLKNNMDYSCKDMVVRFNGDEFLMLYNKVTFQQFEDKIARIMDKIAEIQIDGYPEIQLTVSVGGAYNGKGTQSTYQELIRMADFNLQFVKEQGKDGYKVNEI